MNDESLSTPRDDAEYGSPADQVPGRRTIVISVLAVYQARFWAEVGAELERRSLDVAFLSFDDPSTELLSGRGLRVYAPEAAERRPDVSDAAFAAACERYAIGDANHWFAHERTVFSIADTLELRRKLLMALALATRALRELSARAPTVLVQELGGFLSVVGSFCAARAFGIDNWFIEPAFFRGRLMFERNSFAAPRIEGDLPDRASPEVVSYLDRTLAARSIVIPLKDRHQYHPAARKIFNTQNLRRLAGKLRDKYLRRRHMEFGYIWQYAGTHMRMLLNSFRLHSQYTALADLHRFVYYPLHVPGDMALTLRSPQFLDQLALVDYLARAVPHTHRLAIKEHPAMIGAIDAGRLRSILARYDNVVLLAPSNNNYEVMQAADAVVSVNSKSGAEAALIGKPVAVLGDAFYRGSPLVHAVDNLADVGSCLRKLCSVGGQSPARDRIDRYFELVWRRSHPGELYVSDAANIEAFTSSLLSACDLTQGRPRARA